MKEIQGYLAIIPNDPSGRGLVFFNESIARAHKEELDRRVREEWDNPRLFDHNYWCGEKPLPVKVFTLIVKDEITINKES